MLRVTALGRLFGSRVRSGPGPFDDFVDRLLSTFENCRAGLDEEPKEDTERFFLELYEREIPRLRESLRLEESLLTPEAREELFGKVDTLIRRVVVPAYTRLAVRFTARERNDFFLLSEPLHGLERALWAGAGLALGAFVVWAPFIPLWEKEWILPFLVAGLFVPSARRFLALKRYESDLNGIVERANREVTNIDSAYITSGEPLAERAERGTVEAASRNRARQKEGWRG